MAIAETAEVKSIRDEHERALDALLQISYAVGSVMDLPEILTRIVAETSRLFEADVCSVFLLEDDKKRLRLRATQGHDPVKNIFRWSVIRIG